MWITFYLPVALSMAWKVPTLVPSGCKFERHKSALNIPRFKTMFHTSNQYSFFVLNSLC